MKKKLYKSTKNKKIAGVCGGLAEYFGIDVTWVRLAFCFLALFASVGIWPYLIFALVLPKDTDVAQEVQPSDIPFSPEQKVCPICGAVVNGEDVFCQSCGAEVK